jgi:hypothetical protein
MSAMVRIVWHAPTTIVDPKRFPDVAAAIAQLFARAHIVLASLKAGGVAVNHIGDLLTLLGAVPAFPVGFAGDGADGDGR